MNAYRSLSALLAASLVSLLAACSGGGGGAPAVLNLGPPQFLLEGSGAAPASITIPITLTQTSATATSVRITTVNGGATGGSSCAVAGVDYLTLDTTLTIPANASSASFTLTVCPDAGFESSERFRVVASIAAGEASLEVTLVNDDAGGLNDTGVTACAGGAASCPGEDAAHGRDAQNLVNGDEDGHAGFSWTKLDAAGAALALDATAWDCVRDNATGLVWEAKTDDGGARDGALLLNHAQALAYVTAVNALAPCGFSDWRLPEPLELAMLMHHGRGAGALADPAAFPEQRAHYYWSGTDAAADAAAAWVLDYASGALAYQDKTETAHVRLVRATATLPAARYVDHDDGALSDLHNGLMWRVCADGLSGPDCSGGARQAYTWRAALNRVAAANAAREGGHGDWRLPNREELLSIVARNQRAPSVDPALFPGVGNFSYWTSTPYAITTDWAWYVSFLDGESGPLPQSQTRYILLVRDI